MRGSVGAQTHETTKREREREQVVVKMMAEWIYGGRPPIECDGAMMWGMLEMRPNDDAAVAQPSLDGIG